jgi:hypothetical protein
MMQMKIEKTQSEQVKIQDNFKHPKQVNFYTGGRGWYRTCSGQATVESAVGLMTKYLRLL